MVAAYQFDLRDMAARPGQTCLKRTLYRLADTARLGVEVGLAALIVWLVSFMTLWLIWPFALFVFVWQAQFIWRVE